MKSPMSKWLSLGALAMALASPFSSAVADTKSVAATAIVEHPALDSVRDGVRAALEEAGYTVGDNLKWQYQTAQGNTATAGQIARKFVGDKPDVIVAIATPSAQAVVASTKSIPVVFAAVTDPLAAQLVSSWEASDTNVTGVSDELELDRQMELVKQVVPNATRVGMVYNPGEANSVVVVERLRELRSEEHTSELRHVRISYAVFCLKKKRIQWRTSPRRCRPTPIRTGHLPTRRSSSAIPTTQCRRSSPPASPSSPIDFTSRTFEFSSS